MGFYSAVFWQRTPRLTEPVAIDPNETLASILHLGAQASIGQTGAREYPKTSCEREGREIQELQEGLEASLTMAGNSVVRSLLNEW
jgi:hypothetical protein